MQDKKPDLSFFHVFGVLCYPTNDNDDLGKLDAKDDIVFDEYFTPLPIAVTLVQEVVALRAVVANSLVSTFIDQDAPSSSTPSTQEQEQSPIISQGFEESPKTPIFCDGLLNESSHEESTYLMGSSSNVKEEGIRFAESFALIARIKGHPYLHSKMPPLRIAIFQMDVKTAFLNSELKEECNDLLIPNLTTKFNDVNDGKMSYLLRLQFLKVPRASFINQSKYASEIVKKYGMLSTDSVDTPLVEKSKLDEDLHGTQVDATHLHGIIGSLCHLTSSRPNLIHAVYLCAQYQAKPTEKHLQAHMQKQTTRRSTSGSAQFLGDKLVSWSLKKQKCIAISSTEAEYIALSGFCAQISMDCVTANNILFHSIRFLYVLCGTGTHAGETLSDAERRDVEPVAGLTNIDSEIANSKQRIVNTQEFFERARIENDERIVHLHQAGVGDRHGSIREERLVRVVVRRKTVIWVMDALVGRAFDWMTVENGGGVTHLSGEMSLSLMCFHRLSSWKASARIDSPIRVGTGERWRALTGEGNSSCNSIGGGVSWVWHRWQRYSHTLVEEEGLLSVEIVGCAYTSVGQIYLKQHGEVRSEWSRQGGVTRYSGAEHKWDVRLVRREVSLSWCVYDDIHKGLVLVTGMQGADTLDYNNIEQHTHTFCGMCCGITSVTLGTHRCSYDDQWSINEYLGKERDLMRDGIGDYESQLKEYTLMWVMSEELQA
ncbi:hypothetical protein Tco_0155081 [Tanacetum coccineum]